MRKHNFCELDEIMACNYLIFAHTSEDNKADETLEEHTLLCQNYYKDMIVERALEGIESNFLNVFLPESSQEENDLFYEMLDNVITFHDTGKCNPAFQKQIMQKTIKQKDFEWIQGNHHSLLSAIIYINYYMNKIEGLKSKIDRGHFKILKGLCLANGYVISRHHSQLCNFNKFLSQLEENGLGNIIFANIENVKLIKHKVYNKYNKLVDMWWRFQDQLDRDGGIYLFSYVRFLFSILVSADYYATSEYRSGTKVISYGKIEEKEDLVKCYEETDLIKSIRNMPSHLDLSGINQVRTEMFLEAEENLIKNIDKNLFFLEAPTGSGKSNVSMNISFQLLKKNYHKIFYVYPFNTLVEQNINTLKNIFGKNKKIFEKIVTVNSNTPIKMENGVEECNSEEYKKALLDRQFLNYPFILTTHVSLFQTMFGAERETVFGFSQLANSVIVLDEIQSYKNSIWTEIIIFLQAFAKILNLKIIIMSATLPDLEYLTKESGNVVRLITNREKYFLNPLFKDRVKVSYDLLEMNMDLDILKEHLSQARKATNNILIEFIKRKRAYEFYSLLKNDEVLGKYTRLITGDDNQAERNEILEEIKANPSSGLILVATQVIEAGVDIDMDVGYKDISKLDSEEQFMGRINRSCKNDGLVYFFNLDDAGFIYQNDYRKNKEFTLVDCRMQEILTNKNFADYYQPILDLIEKRNLSYCQEDRLEIFFDEKTKGLEFANVQKRMQLIDETDWEMPVFLSRIITVNNIKLDGEEVWDAYRNLLMDRSLEYAKRRVLLSQVRSQMNYFVYKIKKSPNLSYDDKIGDLYFIRNSEKYFTDGKLDREKLEQDGGMFIY